MRPPKEDANGEPRLPFKEFITFLLVAVFFVKLISLGSLPFSYDETIYAEMIAEEGEHPSFLPTYLGYPAPWKPGLSFFAYSLFLPFSSAVFDSLEYIYRFPVILFGLLNAWLFYLLVKRFFGKDAALLSTLPFYSSLSAFYAESRLLMEPFMLSTILCSLLFYTDRNMQDSKRFLFGAFFAFISAISKTLIALLIPLLVVAYAIQHERKQFKNPAFLLSLLAVPFGLFLFWFSLNEIGLSREIFFALQSELIIYNYQQYILGNFFTGLAFISILMLPLISGAAISLASRWQKSIMFLVWLAPLVILLFLGQRIYYYYYVTPPAALFTALLLLRDDKRIDLFALLAALAFVLLSIYVVIFTPWNPEREGSLFESRAIGLSLAGDENVLFVGQFSTNSVSIAYKTLAERQSTGSYLDFGYILFCPVQNHVIPPDAPADFVQDYWRRDYPIEERDFSMIYQSSKIIRKNTSITDFDYVVVSPVPENLSIYGYSPYIKGNYSTVYRRIE